MAATPSHVMVSVERAGGGGGGTSAAAADDGRFTADDALGLLITFKANQVPEESRGTLLPSEIARCPC